jgi:hypothetical protein
METIQNVIADILGKATERGGKGPKCDARGQDDPQKRE